MTSSDTNFDTTFDIASILPDNHAGYGDIDDVGELEVLHDREYRVRAFRLSAERLLIRGAVRDLGGIKAASADQNVLTIEYLTALARIGDGRATKLVIPAEFSGLLGTLAALVETGRPEDRDELQPRGGLPIPRNEERVELPPAADAP